MAQMGGNTKNRGSGFVNINEILNANKGYGENLGKTVGQGLQNQAGTANTTASNAWNTFNTGLNDSKNKAFDTLNKVGNFAKKGDASHPGETDEQYAERVSKDTQDFGQLGKDLADTSYKGPKEIKDLQDIRNKISQTNDLGYLAGNSGGQRQVLGNFVANRNRGYNLGQSNLDQLLLGQSGEGQRALRDGIASTKGANKFTNLFDSIDSQVSNATTGIANTRAATERKIRNNLYGKGDGASDKMTGIVTQAENNAQQYGKDIQSFNDMMSKLSGGTFKPEDYNADIFNRAEEFGFDPSKIDTYASAGMMRGKDNISSEADLKARLGSLRYDTEIGPGERYYRSDTEQGGTNKQNAASNLSLLLNNEAEAKALKEQKFDRDRINETDLVGGIAQDNTRWSGRDNAAKAATEQGINSVNKFASDANNLIGGGDAAWNFEQGDPVLRYTKSIIRGGDRKWDALSDNVDKHQANIKDAQNYANLDTPINNRWGTGQNNKIHLKHGGNYVDSYNAALNNNSFTGKNDNLKAVLQNMFANSGKYKGNS